MGISNLGLGRKGHCRDSEVVARRLSRLWRLRHNAALARQRLLKAAGSSPAVCVEMAGFALMECLSPALDSKLTFHLSPLLPAPLTLVQLIAQVRRTAHHARDHLAATCRAGLG
jgi:hypothetical protein